MLESYTRQLNTIDTTTINRTRKSKQLRGDKTDLEFGIREFGQRFSSCRTTCLGQGAYLYGINVCLFSCLRDFRVVYRHTAGQDRRPFKKVL